MAISPKARASLALAALGVVFGDIGTSPLYTLATCFTTAHAIPTLENTLGIISLLVWALIIVVCIKYVTLLMRVDNDGDGGILALLALALPPRLARPTRRMSILIVTVVIGAAMLVGDGMITPAISVISAVEGLDVATSSARPFIVPISAGVLLALFLLQSRGTERVGRLFGPIMTCWFLAIAIAGILGIEQNPHVIAALNPFHALYFATHHGKYGFLIFGGVILCLTGAEALYADMSHFGRIPITWAWYGLVFPSLILNYLGQGAHLINNNLSVNSPFFALTTGWTLLPMVILATLATVIASQSLISGAFTIAEQAISMTLWPRVKVIHTSTELRGQVYVPFVNAILAVGCLLLVFAFRSSARLAAAYGLAVACTMLATSITFYYVITRVFHWPKRFAVPLMSVFITIDTLFVTSGLPKFLDGAWIPLVISAIIATVSLTWLTGRRALAASMASDLQPVDEFLRENPRPAHPKGTMVLLTRDPDGVPFVKHHPWICNVMAEQSIVLLSLQPVGRPYVPESQRVRIQMRNPTFGIVQADFGYMERPRIKPVLQACEMANFDLSGHDTVFYYGVPATVASSHGMRRWQRGLFAWLQTVSRPLAYDLQIPPTRTVGLGIEVAV